MVFDLFGTLADEPTSKSIITNQIISAKFNIPYGEFEKYWQDSVIDRLSGSLESTNTYFSVMLSELGITVDSSFNEDSMLLKAEIYDYKIKNKSMAANLYLEFLNNFPLSIHYESIRLRLRELAG